MKRWMLLFMMMGCVFSSVAQTDENLQIAREKVKLSTLPFACVKCTPYESPVQSFVKTINSGSPIFTYRDLNSSKKNSNEERFCSIFRWFNLEKSDCQLLVASVSRNITTRQFFVSYKNDKEVDCLECATYSNDDIVMKQWKIDENEQIMISELQIKENRSILFEEEFTSVKAQRVDTYYKVDQQGKFKKVKVQKYRIQDYSREYLMDKVRNIWDGQEKVLDV